MVKQRLIAILIQLRTRWKRRQLDRRLARGADPDTNAELTLRAAQLAAGHMRAARQRSGEHFGGSPGTGAVQAEASAPPREIRACADDLLDLAARLRQDKAAEVQGLAQAALLLTRGASPLDPDSGASLREAVRSARLALEPPRANRPNLAPRRPENRLVAA